MIRRTHNVRSLIFLLMWWSSWWEPASPYLLPPSNFIRPKPTEAPTEAPSRNNKDNKNKRPPSQAPVLPFKVVTAETDENTEDRQQQQRGEEDETNEQQQQPKEEEETESPETEKEASASVPADDDNHNASKDDNDTPSIRSMKINDDADASQASCDARWKDELTDCQTMVEELEEAAAQKAQEQEAELTRVQDELDDCRHSHESVAAELSNLKQRMLQIETELQSAVPKQQAAVHALETCQARHDQSSQALVELREAQQAMENELAAAQSVQFNVQADLASCQNNQTNITQKLVQLQVRNLEMESFLSTVHDQQDELRTCQSHQDNLTAHLAQVEDWNRAIEARLTSNDAFLMAETALSECLADGVVTQQELDRLTVTNEKLDATNDAQSQELIRLRKLLQEERQTSADLIAELDVARAAMNQTQAGWDQTQTDLAASVTLQKDTQAQLESTEKQLDSTQAELRQTRDALSEKRTQLGQTQMELNSSKDLQKETDRELRLTQSTLEATQKDLKRTQDTLEQTNKSWGETKVVLATTTAELKAAQSKQTETDQTLASKVSKLESTQNDLAKTRKLLATEQESHSNSTVEFQGRIQSLQRDLVEQQHQQVAVEHVTRKKIGAQYHDKFRWQEHHAQKVVAANHEWQARFEKQKLDLDHLQQELLTVRYELYEANEELRELAQKPTDWVQDCLVAGRDRLFATPAWQHAQSWWDEHRPDEELAALWDYSQESLVPLGEHIDQHVVPAIPPVVREWHGQASAGTCQATKMATAWVELVEGPDLMAQVATYFDEHCHAAWITLEVGLIMLAMSQLWAALRLKPKEALPIAKPNDESPDGGEPPTLTEEEKAMMRGSNEEKGSKTV